MPQLASSSQGRTIAEAYRLWRDGEGLKGTPNNTTTPWKRAALEWQWAGRAAAYDDELRRERMLEERRRIAAMYRRQAQQAVRMQEASALQLERFFPRAVEVEVADPQTGEITTVLPTVPGEPMRGHEIIRAFAEGVAVETPARGVSPEIMDLVIRLSAMTDDELANHYRNLMGQAEYAADDEQADV